MVIQRASKLRLPKRRPTFQALAALLFLLIAAPIYAQAPPAQPISVLVNGQSVAFTGAPPQQIHDAVMVPLRGVLTQMGATVDYDEATHTVHVQEGSTAISLPIGSTTVTVNGKPQTLTQSAVAIGGTTLVPLRFVSEALGAYVAWDAASQTVRIVTPSAHLSTLPAPPASLGPTFIGQLTGVFTDTNPQQITVRAGAGEVTVLPVAENAAITTQHADEPAAPATLLDLTPGDQVRVTRDAHDQATQIEAIFGRLMGVISKITSNADGSHTILLNTGISVTFVPGAPVTMSGRRVGISQVMASEQVVIRTSLDNKTGYGMAVVTANNPEPNPPGIVPPGSSSLPTSPNRPRFWLAAAQPTPAGPSVAIAVSISTFAADARGPLKAGDTLHASLVGSPGGKASFAIPNVTGEVPMAEISPGHYTGSVTIPKDANVAGGAVVGKLVGADGTVAPLLPSAQTITIDNTPPEIYGQTPPPGSSVAMDRPFVWAGVDDAAGSGVNPQSIHIFLDGLDVTPNAETGAGFVAVRPATPLGSGDHTVAVVAADNVGNQVRSEWHFRIDSSSGQPVELSLAALGDSPASLSNPLHLTLHAAQGASVHIVIPGVGEWPMSEISPGTYQGTYGPGFGSGAELAPVYARVKAHNGDTEIVTLDRGVAIDGETPVTPVILRPTGQDQIDDTFDIEGRTQPGRLVLVTVSYKSKSATGYYEIDGNALSQAVRADAKGGWKLSNATMKSPWLLTSDRMTRITVAARTVDGKGKLSAPATVQVMHT